MKDIDTRSKLSLYSIFIFLDRTVLVEKDFFFRFSLFLKEVEDLSLLGLSSIEVVEDLSSEAVGVVKDLDLIKVVEDLDSVEAVRVLSLEAYLEAYLEASSEASLEALILDLIDLL